MADLDHLASLARDAPGLRAKRDLTLVSRLGPIDGDDAALVEFGDTNLVLCAEAISPALIAHDPFAAGAAAVVTNCSDVRAMGGRPIALTDTVVAPTEAIAARILDGIAWASALMGVPVAGGHLTIGAEPAVSASCVGVAARPLRCVNARPGDALVAAFCLEGTYRGDTPFFTSLRARDPERLRTDGEALVEVAEAGACHAARDVSMPGVAGSLLQMLEIAGCGATLDVDALPRPDGVPIERWLVTFPSFGYVLCGPPERAAEAVAVFTGRGLAAATCGALDDSLVLRLASGGATAEVWDLAAEPLTGLGRSRSPSADDPPRGRR